MLFDDLKRSTFFKRFLFIFFSAFILMFFSEYFFLNTGPTFSLISNMRDDLPAVFVSTLELLLYYTFFSYILFAAIDKFDVKDIWSLFLAGSLFGWWVEGTIIPVMYEALPYSISWPSLGWHALVDVIIGWYIIRRILHRDNFLHTALMSISLGAFWGVWATWFWVDGTEPISPGDFTSIAFALGILLVIAFIMVDKINISGFHISKAEIIVFTILSAAAVGMQGFALGYVPFLVLPPLLVLTFFALWRNKKVETEENIIEELSGSTSLPNYTILLLMPFTAAVVYRIVFVNDLALYVGEVIPPILMIIGAVMFVISFIRKVFRQ